MEKIGMFTIMTNLVLVLLVAFVSCREVRTTPKDYWKEVMGNETPMPAAIQTLLPSHIHDDLHWIPYRPSLQNYPPSTSHNSYSPLTNADVDVDGSHQWMTHALPTSKDDHEWWLHDKVSMSYSNEDPHDNHDDKQDHNEDFTLTLKFNGNAHAKHDHGHPSSLMTIMDPAVHIFFMEKDLKLGKSMPIYFPNRDLSKIPSFLPREKANSIPFSSNQLLVLLQHFNFSPHSHQAQAMEDTLRQCESKPIKGETKLCATSLESMLDFIVGIFGSSDHMHVLTTTHVEKSKILQHHVLQNYSVLEVPVKIHGSNMVACHSMPYPYAVFYCHKQESKIEVFRVKMEGEDGGKVEAIAVCHSDTSDWDPGHVSFRLLKVGPGTVPICHFLPEDNLIWVSTIP